MIGEITVIPQIEGPGREIIKKAVDEIAAHGLRYRVWRDRDERGR